MSCVPLASLEHAKSLRHEQADAAQGTLLSSVLISALLHGEVMPPRGTQQEYEKLRAIITTADCLRKHARDVGPRWKLGQSEGRIDNVPAWLPMAAAGVTFRTSDT